MKKRILSMLMCAMLMLGLFPTTAFAEEQLSAPTGLAWDTSTEGIVKIKWDAVAGTNGYSYQLYKDGEQLPWASTRDTSADVTDILRANGSGTYMFWVSCEGEDGSQLSDWSEYSVEYTYISTVPQLATPTRLAWDENITGKAIWTAVDNASSYEVVFLSLIHISVSIVSCPFC